MGHDFIRYEESSELFNDFDIWTLRHFLIEQSKALTKQPPALTLELRRFLENWEWHGPGVFVGTDLSTFIGNHHIRWELMLELLQATGDRIAEFGEEIPLPYLQANVNLPTAYFTIAQPTRRFLAEIGRISRLLAKHEPKTI